MKHLRHLRLYAAGLGLREARIERRGRHPHLVGVRPDGRVIRYVAPSTPSDGTHGEANARAGLRRLLRPPDRPSARKVGVRVRRRPRRLRLPGMPPQPVLPVVTAVERQGFEALGAMFDQLPLEQQFRLLMEKSEHARLG